MSGFTGTTPFRAAEEIAEELKSRPGLLVVDDWDHLDGESWASVIHVHQQTGAPVLTARTINRGIPGPFTLPGVATFRSISLSMLNVPEMAKVIKDELQHSLDSPTLASVVALSGGNAGIGVALVDAAVESGAITFQNGVGSLAAGALWAPAAEAIAESMLATLRPEARETLEKIVLIGPRSVEELTSELGTDILAELEDLDIIDVGVFRDHEVTLRSPLLYEFFRRRPNRIRQSVVAHQSGVHSTGRGESGISTLETHVALAKHYMRASHRVTESRLAWQHTPSKDTAVEYASAMMAASYPDENVAAVLDEASDMAGSEEAHVRWARLVLRQLMRRTGDLEISEDRWAANLARHPRLEGHIRAHRVIADLVLGRKADLSVLPDTFDGLAEGTEQEVLWARFAVHLMNGELERAGDALGKLGDAPEMTALRTALVVMFDISQGQLSRATHRVEEALRQARTDLDWESIPPLVYATALIAAFSGRFDDLRQDLQDMLNLGAGVKSHFLRQGIAGLSTALYVADGVALPSEFVNETPLPCANPFPACAPEWQQAVELYMQGNHQEAGMAAASHADTLWGQGQRLSSVFATVLSSALWCRPSVVATLKNRVNSLGHHNGFHLYTSFLAPLCEGRLEEAMSVIEEITSNDGEAMVGMAWHLLAREWELRGDQKEADLALVHAANSVATPTTALSAIRARATATGVEWTRREKEIVRYVVSGLTNAEIAETLVISQRTVETHVWRAMKKAGVGTRLQLMEAVGSL